MPTSFLDLPLELRDEIYKLMLPIERGANGEPLAIETDRTYWEEHAIQSLCHQLPDLPLTRTSEEIPRLVP